MAASSTACLFGRRRSPQPALLRICQRQALLLLPARHWMQACESACLARRQAPWNTTTQPVARQSMPSSSSSQVLSAMFAATLRSSWRATHVLDTQLLAPTASSPTSDRRHLGFPTVNSTSNHWLNSERTSSACESETMLRVLEVLAPLRPLPRLRACAWAQIIRLAPPQVWWPWRAVLAPGLPPRCHLHAEEPRAACAAAIVKLAGIGYAAW